MLVPDGWPFFVPWKEKIIRTNYILYISRNIRNLLQKNYSIAYWYNVALILAFFFLWCVYLWQVNQLVEEETRRYRPTKNYLDFLATPDYEAFEVRTIIISFSYSCRWLSVSFGSLAILISTPVTNLLLAVWITGKSTTYNMPLTPRAHQAYWGTSSVVSWWLKWQPCS